MTYRPLIAALLCSLALIAGCGKKGALYLPDNPPDKQAEPAAQMREAQP